MDFKIATVYDLETFCINLYSIHISFILILINYFIYLYIYLYISWFVGAYETWILIVFFIIFIIIITLK